MIIWILFRSSNDTGTPHNQRHPACVTEETEVTASSSNQPKQQSENQVLGRGTAGRSPRTRNALIYINWYINGYGRPWTSSDVNTNMRLKPWTNCR
jgi:hypothetical protein